MIAISSSPSPWSSAQLERLLFLHALEGRPARQAARALPELTLSAWAEVARRGVLRIRA